MDNNVKIFLLMEIIRVKMIEQNDMRVMCLFIINGRVYLALKGSNVKYVFGWFRKCDVNSGYVFRQ